MTDYSRGWRCPECGKFENDFRNVRQLLRVAEANAKGKSGSYAEVNRDVAAHLARAVEALVAAEARWDVWLAARRPPAPAPRPETPPTDKEEP